MVTIFAKRTRLPRAPVAICAKTRKAARVGRFTRIQTHVGFTTHLPVLGEERVTSYPGCPREIYRLNLDENDFEGALPTFDGHTADLRYLYLRENRFSGEIHARLAHSLALREEDGGYLRRLHTLYLQQAAKSDEQGPRPLDLNRDCEIVLSMHMKAAHQLQPSASVDEVNVPPPNRAACTKAPVIATVARYLRT